MHNVIVIKCFPLNAKDFFRFRAQNWIVFWFLCNLLVCPVVFRVYSDLTPKSEGDSGLMDLDKA